MGLDHQEKSQNIITLVKKEGLSKPAVVASYKVPVSNTCKDTMASDRALQQRGDGVSTASALSAAYLCPLKRLPGAILYTRSALANVEGVVEKGPILCCELKSPVPNRGEFQALFITQLNIFADSKLL